MHDCSVCYEPMTAECKGYRCNRGHECHRHCLNSITKKICFVCEEPVKLSHDPKSRSRRRRRRIRPRSVICKGKVHTVGPNKKRKRCRKRTRTGVYCHLHTPAPSESAVIIHV